MHIIFESMLMQFYQKLSTFADSFRNYSLPKFARFYRDSVVI